MKVVTVEGIGEIRLVKSKANRSIKLTVTAHGSVRVSMPRWMPYAAGINFARSHQDWVRRHTPVEALTELTHGQLIGKQHKLQFEQVSGSQAVTSRVTAIRILVRYHPSEKIDSPIVQHRARKAVIRALKKEADQLLPTRIRQYAAENGFSYSSFTAKQLIRRWGSCDSQKNLVFNIYLMQLPWELIDYVIYHELTHTEHMHHQADFWRRLKQVCPRAEDLRRQMKGYQPVIAA